MVYNCTNGTVPYIFYAYIKNAIHLKKNQRVQ